MPAGSSPKRERQFEHIKESYEERGRSEGKAEEIAARTVNKQRAEAGEIATSGAAPSKPSKPAKSSKSSKPASRARSSKTG